MGWENENNLVNFVFIEESLPIHKILVILFYFLVYIEDGLVNMCKLGGLGILLLIKSLIIFVTIEY